jgi:hypothetical protein
MNHLFSRNHHKKHHQTSQPMCDQTSASSMWQDHFKNFKYCGLMIILGLILSACSAPPPPPPPPVKEAPKVQFPPVPRIEDISQINPDQDPSLLPEVKEAKGESKDDTKDESKDSSEESSEAEFK